MSGRIAELIDHHELRLRSILETVGDGRMTVWEIAASMDWSEPWEELPGFMRQVALGEAAAHVRHLVHQGELVTERGSLPVRLSRP